MNDMTKLKAAGLVTVESITVRERQAIADAEARYWAMSRRLMRIHAERVERIKAAYHRERQDHLIATMEARQAA